MVGEHWGNLKVGVCSGSDDGELDVVVDLWREHSNATLVYRHVIVLCREILVGVDTAGHEKVVWFDDAP